MEGLEQAWLGLEPYWRIEPSTTLKKHRTYDFLRWIIGPLCRVLLPWKIIGVNNIPKGKKMIIAANHLSHIDPIVIILSARKKIHYLAKDGHFSNFFTRSVMNLTGQIETNRETGGDQALASAATVIADGSTLGIFPEGTRSLDGKMKPFKKGGIILAINAGLPIVPMACCGTYDVLVKGSKTFNPKSIELRFAPPISTKQNDMDNRNEITKRVENEVKRLKSEWNNIDLN